MTDQVIEGYDAGYRVAQEEAFKKVEALIDTNTPEALDNAIWDWFYELKESLKPEGWDAVDNGFERMNKRLAEIAESK